MPVLNVRLHSRSTQGVDNEWMAVGLSVVFAALYLLKFAVASWLVFYLAVG